MKTPRPAAETMKSQAADLNVRINQLRASSGLTYEEIAEELGVSRTTLHFIRNGTQKPTERFLNLLQTMEQCGGRVPKPDNRTGTNLLALVLAPYGAPTTITVTGEQLSSGHIDVPVRFFTDDNDSPTHTVTLQRPGTMEGIKTFMSAVVNQTFEDLILVCMPTAKKDPQLLNKLTPTSILNLLEAALQLIFGKQWRQETTEVVKRTLPKGLHGLQETMVNTGLTTKDIATPTSPAVE